MKIENLSRDDHQVQLVVEFDAELLEKYSRRAARKISQGAKIPGFRPGKAPYDVIKRVYGEDYIQQQAVELLIDDQYAEVLKEAGIDPSGPGNLEEIISVNPPKFSFIVPLMPVVELCDYKSIQQEYNPEPISEEEVEKFIKNIRTNFAASEPVDRPVEEGDLVYAILSGKLTNPDENEDPDVIKENPSQFVVGGSDFQPDNYPYEGFSKELLGLSEGDEKTIQYTYPDDSPLEKLKGKSVEFQVKVQSIKVLVLPDMDDDFAGQVGPYETVEQMMEQVREQLEQRKNQDYDEKYYSELIDEKIVKESTVKYPPHMLQEEIDHVLEEIKDNLAQQSMDLDTLLKIQKKDLETFIEEEVRPSAEMKLTRALVLEEIAKNEKLELDRGELENAVAQTMMQLQQMPGFEEYKPAQKFRSLTNAVTMDTANRLYNQRLLKHLKAIATGELDTEEASEVIESASEETVVENTSEGKEPTSDEPEA